MKGVKRTGKKKETVLTVASDVEDFEQLAIKVSAAMEDLIEKDDKQKREEDRSSRLPAVVFGDTFIPKVDLNCLSTLLDKKLNEIEEQCLTELNLYMLENQGSRVFSNGFLEFVGRLLILDVQVRVRIMQILANAALKEDIILLLHQDRNHHTLMKFAYDFENHSIYEQKAISTFMCNLFENTRSAEWLMYVTKWMHNSVQTFNLKVTTKVAVHTILSEDVEMQNIGSAMIHNLATRVIKPVAFEEVAVELTTAILRYLSSAGSKPEGNLFCCLKALSEFTEAAGQEISQLIRTIGPHPSNFIGKSNPINCLVKEISMKLGEEQPAEE